MTDNTTCVIAGGGPAGMVLGLLLARAGIEVTVLEKHADFLRDFRGDTVHPSTMALLDELGLGEQFASLPQSRVTEIAFPIGDGDQVVVGDLQRLRVAHPYISITPQWDFLDLLARSAAAEPTFTLRMRTEVTGLLRQAGRVRGVRYRDENGTPGELAADLTVACDGRNSVLRRAAGLPAREFPVPIDAWWFRLPRAAVETDLALTPRMHRRRLAIVIPREGYYQIAYIGKKGTDAALRAGGIERFRGEVAAVLPALADRVHTLTSLDEVKHLDVRLDRLRRWHTDGLLCLGDAAHAMSPIGGVGINLAVQDAVAAAALLAEPLRRRAAYPRALARVRARRLAPTVAVQRLQQLMHRLIAQPVIDGRRVGPPAPMVTLLRRAPWLSFVPAYLIGVGIRPERAPAFARRGGRTV